MATEICQKKDETVLKTARKLCNSGEVGHMYILDCEVAQQIKFVIREARGFPPRPEKLQLVGYIWNPTEDMSSGTP